MHPIFTTINAAFTAIREARPISHAAAVTLLGTSIYAVHEGVASVAPANLAAAGTAAMIGAEWLQWTALGRLAKLEGAGEHGRAAVLKGQCVGVGAFQVAGYTLAILSFAHAAGHNWAQGWSLAGVIAFAALFAALNFVAKWTSCDAVATKAGRGPTGGQRVHEALFNTPALAAPAADAAMPADWSDDPTVVTFMKRVEHTGMKFAKDAEAAKAPPVRDAAVRLRLATKRIRVRAQRDTAKQQAAA